MDDGVIIEYVNAVAQDQQMISDAVKEYEKVLGSEQPVNATPKLDLFLEWHQSERLKNAKDLLQRMNIPLVLLHHEWIEKESHQPAGELEDPEASIYQFVKGKLDHWTGDQRDMGHGQPAGCKPDSAYELIVWSTELWFFQQLQGADDVNIDAWISTEGAEKLFRQYFGPTDNNAPRFTIITETNACTLLRQLINVGKEENKTENMVANKLKNFLKKWQNIRDLTADTSMSKDMASIYDNLSEKFYVIPSSPDMKMYGMHFHLTNFFKENAKGKTVSDAEAIEHASKEAECMRKAMKRCNFEIREPTEQQFGPTDGTFSKLESWLSKELLDIKESCSMLFISFSLHGKQGSVMDAGYFYETIEKIVGWISLNKKLDELRKVPKVMVFQTCQHVPEHQRPAWKNHYDKISRSLQRSVEDTNNLRLLMPVEQGEDYRCDPSESYLNYFAKAMEEVQRFDPPTIDMVHTSAQGDADKASKTQMRSSDSREVLLRTPVPTPPVGESSEGYDHSADSAEEDEEEDEYSDLK